MNIMDVMSNEDIPVPEEGRDQLDQLFDWQGDLERKYIEIESANGLRWDSSHPLDLREDAAQMQFQDFSFRTIAELMEMTECLKNRPHKSTQMPTDKDHFYEEFSDSFHFLLGTCWVIGMEADDLYDQICGDWSQGNRLSSLVAAAAGVEKADIKELPQRRWVLEYPVDLDHPKGQLQIKDLTFDIIRSIMLTNDDLDMLVSPEANLAQAVRQFLGLGWALGMSADDIYKVYWAKMQVNRFRQETNY